MVWMFMSPLNPYVENLMTTVMVLGSLWEVLYHAGGALIYEISIFRDHTELLLSSTIGRYNEKV